MVYGSSSLIILADGWHLHYTSRSSRSGWRLSFKTDRGLQFIRGIGKKKPSNKDKEVMRYQSEEHLHIALALRNRGLQNCWMHFSYWVVMLLSPVVKRNRPRDFNLWCNTKRVGSNVGGVWFIIDANLRRVQYCINMFCYEEQNIFLIYIELYPAFRRPYLLGVFPYQVLRTKRAPYILELLTLHPTIHSLNTRFQPFDLYILSNETTSFRKSSLLRPLLEYLTHLYSIISLLVSFKQNVFFHLLHNQTTSLK